MDKRNIEKEYKDAVDSLQQLNNELFYNELKNNLNEHIERIELSQDKTSKEIDHMKKVVQRLPIEMEDELNNMTSEFTYRFQEQMEKTGEKITGLFNFHAQALSKVIKNFSVLQSNFSKIHTLMKNQNENQNRQMDEFIECQQNQFKEIESSLEEYRRKMDVWMKSSLEDMEKENKNHRIKLDEMFMEHEKKTSKAIDSSGKSIEKLVREMTDQMNKIIEFQNMESDVRYGFFKKAVVCLAFGQIVIIAIQIFNLMN